MNDLINKKFKRYTHGNLSEWTDRVKAVELQHYIMTIREDNPDVPRGYVEQTYLKTSVIVKGHLHSHQLSDIVFVS